VAIYLGFDSSTQSLTATVIEIDGARHSVIATRTFQFDDALPSYGTHYGVLTSEPRAPSLEHRHVVHAPPLMWAEALEVMFDALTSEHDVDWSQLRAISGSAQQHGSVYLNARAAHALARLDGTRGVAAALKDALSRATSPIWMDSSTTEDCAAIEAAVGGPAALARITGSRAYERFTGPQIRKFARESPDAYQRTDRIHLVSSWMASLLSGAHAAIDKGDGSGMNLMDLATGQWSRLALDATAPDLGSKLPPLVSSSAIVGTLAPYWQRRFNLPPARIVAWSGDNLCSLVGTGLIREGQLAISLGTSDTIFGVMSKPLVSADGTGHVFASPTGEFMGMTVFKNGSLARERIRDLAGLDWNGFSEALRRTPPGNQGAMLLPWFEPEITPLVLTPGLRTIGLPAEIGTAHVRAVVEAQMMSLALHSRWMKVTPAEIRATGGAAANREILQVAADVFDAPVQRTEQANSAALGAALRAWHGDGLAGGSPVPWGQVVAGFTDPAAASRVLPVRANVEVYRRLLPRYADWEAQMLSGIGG
jgi:xylulokinase